MRIYYEIETSRRELDARILFSILCAQKGYSIVIGKKNRLIDKISYLSPGIFIFKSSRDRPFQLSNKLKKLGYSIFTSDEEGLIKITPREVLHRTPKKTIQVSEKFLAWGKEQAQVLKDNYKDYQEKISVIGNSRFDLLKKPIRSIYNKDVDRIKKKFGKFDLYISAFHKYNAITVNGKNWFNAIESWGEDKKESKIRKKLYKNMFELQKKNMISTIKFLNSNSKKMNNVIIRPHPSENIDLWKKKLNKDLKKNVIFDDINTNAWILAADRVFSYFSTSLIEANILGKDSYNLIFKKGKIYETKIFKKNTITIYNPKNFKDLQTKINKNKKRKFILSKNIFFENTQQYSANIFLKEIRKFTDTKFINQNKKDKYNNLFYFIIFKIILKLKFFFHKNDHKKQIFFQKNPGITFDMVNNKLNKICSILNLKNIIVDEIYPGVFEIKKKI